MTTKPRARKFRIRPPDPDGAGTPGAADLPDVAAVSGSPHARPDAAPSYDPGTAAEVPDATPAETAAPAPAARAARPRIDPARPPGAVAAIREDQVARDPAGAQSGAPTDARADTRAPSGRRASAAGATGGDIGQTDLAAIRAEGLTGRQLRMARRVAQKNGLTPESDHHAVRLLRLRGIDPFTLGSTLELVVTRDPGADRGADRVSPAAPPGGRVQLPQTRPADPALPSTETRPPPSPAERRAEEIARIQRDLARRRRRKLALLFTRLAFFVLLPGIAAGYYFYAVATPLYSTKSQFLILTNDGGGGGVGGLLSGTQFATNQDAIAVQSYLASKDAMLRLDGDEGFKAHFSQDWIDPIQRLAPEASNEEAYDIYQRNVEIGYDPTEGVIKMEVTAADPVVAAEFSRALISYAEERVDNLSLRKRANAVLDAEAGLSDAEAARRAAQERLVRLQQESSLLDPEGRIAALRSQINTFEVQLQEKRLQLQALLDNPRPNQSRVDGASADIRRLEAVLTDLNTRMTQAADDGSSLADIAAEVQLAEADVLTRDMMLQSALERLETARRDADAQARYLTTSVVPLASEDPSYPRKFENTVLAFLILSGIYLMISLTASVLREQVSS